MIAALLLLAVSHQSLTPASQYQTTLRTDHLSLAVSLDYDKGRLNATATFTLTNPSDHPIATVPLLLNRLLRVDSVLDPTGHPLQFRQRIAAFEDVATFQVNMVDVALEAALGPGQATRIQVAYGGHLTGYTEVGMQYVRDRVDRDFTVLREDAFAFPVVGWPYIAANRASPRPPFSFDVAATVPAGLVVATGGTEVGRDTIAGQVTWRFRSRSPAPFLLVAIAPYQLVERDGIRVYAFPADSVGSKRVLDRAIRAVDRYATIFGPLGKPVTATIIEIPEGWGSQASLAGGIIQDAAAFRDPARLGELYHELSHLWNAADLDQPSPRWNEGLAMFLQGRLARELDGWTGEEAALQRTAARLVEQCGRGHPCGRVPPRDFGSHGLTDYSYSVGRLMFAALYRALGPADFDRALRTHWLASRDRGTRTDDLVAAFRAVGGEPARKVFAEWLESTAWIRGLSGAAAERRPR